MRFGYVLLGLVALTSIHISSGQCTNGFAGVQKDDICCDPGCGTCGGSSCGQQPPGRDSCCTSRIRESGMVCSDTQSAPCIIDNDGQCSNGLLGVQKDDICCDPDCGMCGGSSCGQQTGGADSCCTSRIRNSGEMCSETQAAPCIIDDVLCSNGVPGVEKDGSCCEAQCGTCGGSGCGKRPGGKEGCCTSQIQYYHDYCSDTGVAPCIIYYPNTYEDDC